MILLTYTRNILKYTTTIILELFSHQFQFREPTEFLYISLNNGKS